MKIVVFAKTVRFLQAQTGANPKQNYIGPGDLVDAMNPFDEAAIEEALRIKDADRDTEISVVSLGGPAAETELRRSLAIGVDTATHIVCDDYDKLDSWATATILAAQARRARFQLILCGREAIDSNAGLVGPYLAARLAIPHISRVVKIERSGADGKIVVQRRVDRGDREIVACQAPALLTVEKGINTPRYPALPALLKARERTIETLTLEDLETPETPLGPASNRTETVRLSNPKPKRRRHRQLNTALSAADRRKLLMKGGTAATAKEDSAVLEGLSDDVLVEFERLLKSCGVSVKATT
jgi:electron transfer flavoprotein beta subunit